MVKKTRLRSPGARIGEPVGQLDGLRVGVGPDREVGQLAGLFGGGVGQLVAAVPGLHDEQAGQTVEVPPAVGVVDVRAVAARDDRYRRVRVGRQPREVHPEVVACGSVELVVVERVVAHRVPQA